MATAFLLALALMAQDAPVSTAPTASAPPPRTQPAATAPTDDYGYVGWCYGALGGYVELYDRVMPEVTRIEKTFPGPDGFASAMKEYPAMRTQAQSDLKVYRAAIVAAEKASPRPIAEYGATAIKKGRSVWGGAEQVDKARLAQVWMSWSPPGDCETRAKTLEKRSNLLGQALNYNVKKDAVAAEAAPPQAEPTAVPDAAPVASTAIEAPVATPPVAEPETPVADFTVVKKPAAKPATKPVAKKPVVAAPTPKPEAEAEAAKPLPTMDAYVAGTPIVEPTPEAAAPAAKPLAKKAEFIVDPNNPQPCAGSLLPAKRGGKSVLVCKPD